VFDFLEGELARKSPTEAVVAVNGVGYLLSISTQCFLALPERGTVRLYVHVHTTNESATRLFGFLEERERQFFRTLQCVNGVGPALALTLLSYEPPKALAARIDSGDKKALTRIKGIGTKTADRLVFELKGRLELDPAAVAASDSEQQVVQALENLGHDAKEAALRARAAAKALGGDASAEALLRQALRKPQ
jgi:Holliday junction DNA helicase RuvA